MERKIAPFLSYSILNFILWRILFAPRWPHNTRAHILTLGNMEHKAAVTHLEKGSTQSNCEENHKIRKYIFFFTLNLALTFGFFSSFNDEHCFTSLQAHKFIPRTLNSDSSMLSESLHCARWPLMPSGPRLSADSLSTFTGVLRRP